MRKGVLRCTLYCFLLSVLALVAGTGSPLSAQPVPGESAAGQIQTGALQGVDPAGSYSLHGTVVNRFTGQPIPRALVGVLDRAVLTDGDGRFEFTGLPPVFTAVTLRKPGYLDPNGQPTEGWQRGIAIGPDTPELTLSLLPEAVITGELTLPNSEPAESFQVLLFRRTLQDGRAQWNQGAGSLTNSQGKYRFADLGPGTYYLVTQAHTGFETVDPFAPNAKVSGFPPVYYGSGVEFSAGSQFTLTAGQRLQADLALVREPFHSVSIAVTNPQTGVYVQADLQDKSGRPESYPVGYDMQQQKVRAVLPNGSYVLQARTYSPNGQRIGQIAFTVEENPRATLAVTLLPMAKIPVTVKQDFAEETPEDQQRQPDRIQVMTDRGPSSQALPRVSLSLIPVDGSGLQGNLQPEPGGPDDAWQLTDVPPGRYWVQAEGIRGYIASITSAGVDLTREPLVVGAGGSSAAITVTLRNDTATLTATLSNPDGPSSQTPRTAFLYLVPQFDFVSSVHQAQISTGQPSEAANFGGMPSVATLSGLAPGSYTLYTFATPQELEYHNPEAMQAYSHQGQTVTLTAHDTTAVEVNVGGSAK